MNSLFEKLTAQFGRNAPASREAIRQFEVESGVALREDYAAFLMYSNGGEGFIGGGYAIFWRVEELIENNKSYRVGDFAPDLFLFGSDGGGEAFAFDRRSKDQVIVSVPFIPLKLECALVLSPTFTGFLEMLSSL